MFGKWLRDKRTQYMKENKVSRERFADDVGYSLGHLKGIEEGSKKPPLEDGLKAIARALNLSECQYDEMIIIAFKTRKRIENEEIKGIIESTYGPVTWDEYNSAVRLFESCQGFIVKLYQGILQESFQRKLIKYIDQLRTGQIKYIPIEDLKTIPEDIKNAGVMDTSRIKAMGSGLPKFKLLGLG